MKTDEIRKKFLDFFASKGHKIIASDSLVPKDDPTVLFTTAGMQQFKRQFLGYTEGYTRAASSQKCLRTDDLDQVGKTPYHHTFFEMLGNFSFGDYFKKEAIEWAWEFLTSELKIPENKLWVSVYKEDSEAEKIWLKTINIPKGRLVKLADKSNFWPSEAKTKGPNGPCGPCSEIFYDYGKDVGCGKTSCSPDCDCGRFSEVWNLVFTQFNRKDGGVLEPLPNKNIDTGMGLERLAAVMQGKKNNFETDLFAPILDAISSKLDTDKHKIPSKEKRIIADHIRAIVFGISDGVMPSNEGRGYVIKKLIIDITDIMLRAGKTESCVYKLTPSVVGAMRNPYPKIEAKYESIQDIVKNIEESYIRVRKERIPELEEQIKEIKKISGTDQAAQQIGHLVFTYRDTYGLTILAIQETLKKEGVPKSDQEKAMNIFDKLMLQQQQRSRKSSKIPGDVFADAQMNLDAPKTVFFGYTQHIATAKVLKILRGTEEIKQAKKGDEIKVVLDQTPFYAESGGQIGDTGSITKNGANIKITDTQEIADIFLHIGVVHEGIFKTGDTVNTCVDSARRLSIMRNHTATHLLQAALRTVLGSHIKQQGSLVTDDRLRFDFTHPKAVTGDELKRIEMLINDYILSCTDVARETVTLDEARKRGALAFFAEKYSDTVNVVSIGDYSKELCGGTHLQTVGQIGVFKIISESAIAQGIRRIEAKTGYGALGYIHENEKRLVQIAKILKSSPIDVVNRFNKEWEKRKEIEHELAHLRFESVKHSINDIIKKATDVKDIKVIVHTFKNIEAGLLRKISDNIKQKAKSAVIILGSQNDNDVFVIIASTDDAIKKGFKANELIKTVASEINGSGGGRPQLAQAGSKAVTDLDKALQKIITIIKKKV